MNVGSNISQILDQRLTYTVLGVEILEKAVPLQIIIPSVLVVVVIIVCVILIIFVCFCPKSRKNTVSIAMHEQIMELMANR